MVGELSVEKSRITLYYLICLMSRLLRLLGLILCWLPHKYQKNQATPLVIPRNGNHITHS